MLPDKSVSEASSELADLFLPNFLALDIESDNSLLGDQNCVDDQDSSSHIVTAYGSSQINQTSVKESSERYSSFSESSNEHAEYLIKVRRTVGDALKCSSDFKAILDQHRFINESKLPNFVGCRFPVHTNMNIKYMREMLSGYNDTLLCDLLEFGFPIGFEGDVPSYSASVKNHSGATRY